MKRVTDMECVDGDTTFWIYLNWTAHLKMIKMVNCICTSPQEKKNWEGGLAWAELKSKYM